MVYKLDRILDSMAKPKLTPGIQSTVLFKNQIEPFIRTELPTEFVDVKVLVIPFDDMYFEWVAGYTACDGLVFINQQYLNPTSSWYKDLDYFSTLVHEWVHNQGIDFCYFFDTDYTETMTQLGTLEVLAASAPSSPLSLYLLLDELRHMYMQKMLVKYLQEGPAGLDKYKKLSWKVFQDPNRIIRLNRVYKELGRKTLLDLAKRYYVKVSQLIDEAKARSERNHKPPYIELVTKSHLVLDDLVNIMNNLEVFLKDD
ncbi:MAG: hypothetical protein QXQ02_03700 [Halobacteria archaeon]